MTIEDEFYIYIKSVVLVVVGLMDQAIFPEPNSSNSHLYFIVRFESDKMCKLCSEVCNLELGGCQWERKIRNLKEERRFCDSMCFCLSGRGGWTKEY